MERRIFIGDLQGCCTPLERLLERLRFDPACDRLLLAGDLVNRGGESLAALRLVHSLREVTTTVLGNHDLHLLAYARGLLGKPNAEFDEILADDRAGELLNWLQHRPLMWFDESAGLAMVHAGVDPRWGPVQARECAAEVERALAESPDEFFANMYGDEPDRWEPDLPEAERLRTITNVMTRMRFCSVDGRLDFAAKGGLESAPPGFAPWFHHLHEDWRAWTLVFGHWSQLGLYEGSHAICLDSGCVWGGLLTALVIEGEERYIETVDCGRR
ncbi:MULTISPECIES: symmetrical bis(5'-nucleosyl)-tetraphosphatase [unclassified Wenzhouxiangella]|uniref:symmetrical bis(5'-nucleosyl)-tetraphosphatase n=1 Tax=unclassified Wenzhouxiangella TaxID=2613841 RepID=UPI000E32B594|nr:MULTISPECIES: symmetrical bis(5'-nucleosyl)-tetraphosphatase [unclassified Wenzhouxiangella]RFF27900.1 symmetrical bis(5'-nucleosyl)-tetraphosphatase [Wenzhouxiangella sp. 15181]RFP67225.1 symmetrical bis(5'-nucleosyl)-tetraphosphatase [Wenzhouxiangella sp. 15190]